MPLLLRPLTVAACLAVLTTFASAALADDPIAQLQKEAAEANRSEVAHWGPNPEKYSSWTTHSNRLIPLYTFGLSLDSVRGPNSIYRDEEKLRKLYGSLPTETLNPQADYFDQTDVYRLQKEAAAAGKRRIILIVFDGMDWQTTYAAAIAKSGQVGYKEGRGSGLHFQDYRGAETDYGWFVTSPHNDGTNVDVNRQIVTSPGGKTPGGYAWQIAGEFPWSVPTDPGYLIAKGEEVVHAYTDSASSAVSMTAGIKTYNNAVNVDAFGREVLPLARTLQDEGWHIGVVTSVPISHATPAAAYSNNVHRNDYQDLTRDLIGRPSIFHPGGVPGVDVLIGAGWGEERDKDGAQGENYSPGNRYLAPEDREAIDVANGGRYVVAERTPGRPGPEVLREAVAAAKQEGHRLFGFFGTRGGHLPYQTADGNYDPVVSAKSSGPSPAEEYSEADIQENVTLAEMSVAALEVLEAKGQPWWLLVEAGDVDWANHANNLDNSIGAVLSGDEAFRRIVEWIEAHGGWDETCLLLTADHGHYLVLDRPELLVP